MYITKGCAYGYQKNHKALVPVSALSVRDDTVAYCIHPSGCLCCCYLADKKRPDLPSRAFRRHLRYISSFHQLNIKWIIEEV